MRKAIVWILVLTLCLSMCACGKKTDNDAAAGTTGTTGAAENNTTTDTTDTTVITGDTTPQATENTEATQGDQTPKPTTPAHTHSWKAATCTAPKTCACGATEGAAAGHSWKAATCTAPKTCTKCNKTEGAAVAHTYTNGTCTACGAKDNFTHTFGTLVGYVASLSADGTRLDCYQLCADAIYYKTFFAEKPERGYYEIQEHKGKFYYCEAPSWGICPFESATTSGRTITLESYGETLKIELTTDNKYKLTAGTDAISAGLVFTMGDRCDIIGHNSSVKCEGDVKCWDCDKVLCAGFGHEFGDDNICFRCFEVERPGA